MQPALFLLEVFILSLRIMKTEAKFIIIHINKNFKVDAAVNWYQDFTGSYFDTYERGWNLKLGIEFLF